MIIDNEIIKQIPVVASIVKFGKVALTIRERYLIKKLVTFIESINNGDIEPDVLENHKQMLENNSEKLNKELEKVMILIDRQLEIDKTKILAELYKSYISRKLQWSDFLYFSEILEGLFMIDLQQLKLIYETEFIEKNKTLQAICMSRLQALGLVEYFSGMVVSVTMSDGEKKQIKGRITGHGKIFYEMGPKKLIDIGSISL